MNLYLSSLDLPNPEKYLSLFAQRSPRIAVIGNAWDPYLNDRKKKEVVETLNHLSNIGTVPEEIDLRIIVRDDGGVENILSGFDGIYVTGGNSFYLNYILRRTGMDVWLRSVPKNFVYAGVSAGAVVAGTTLQGIQHLDDPSVVQEPIFEGIGLIPFGIIPHWESAKYGEKLRACHMAMAEVGEVKTMTDVEDLSLKS